MKRGVFAACLLALAGMGSGCSSSRMAVGFMTPVLDDTVDSALRNDDPILVVDALPTSILLVDGMLRTDPDNRDLARVGALLQFAYAYAHLEAEDPERAPRYYARGAELAWHALDRGDLEHAIRRGTFAELAEAIAKLGPDDAESLLWVCANWGMWIQLEIRDPAAAADLARLMPLAERLAEIDETLFWGMPRILLGALHAGRPVMLGGNLDRAKREFDRAFEISQGNLLIGKVFFARTWCVQSFDADAFQTSLREVLDAPPGRLPEA
ncbi:TRAP transporter TatT component family protein, partial [bacterium]|nr:TRAP transporter TatT component family protein [bacterium]